MKKKNKIIIILNPFPITIKNIITIIIMRIVMVGSIYALIFCSQTYPYRTKSKILKMNHSQLSLIIVLLEQTTNLIILKIINRLIKAQMIIIIVQFFPAKSHPLKQRNQIMITILKVRRGKK